MAALEQPAFIGVEPPPRLFRTATARELCEQADAELEQQLLGPLLTAGNRTLVGAHTGEGKTSLAFQMIRAYLKREDFCGWTGAGGRRVLIIDAEQGLRTIKRRLREAGLADHDDVDILQVPDGLSLDRNAQEVAGLEEILRAGDYAIVVFDPLYKLHTGDSNDERAAVDLMRRLDAWRAEFGFALILTTHLRKEPANGTKLTLHEFFGSSAYSRGAEVIVGLRRLRPGYSRLHFLKDRDGDLPIGEQWGLLFDREQGGFKRDPNDKKPSALERLRELRAADPEITQAQAAAALDVSERTVRNHWKATDPDRDEFDGHEPPPPDETLFGAA